MKINDVVKNIPKTEEQLVSYCSEEGGPPVYKITYIERTDTYKLYKILSNGFQYIKSRTNNPYFPEVYPDKK